MVIDCLAKFVKEAKIQELCNAEALIALLSTREGFAKSKQEAGVEKVFPDEVSVYG